MRAFDSFAGFAAHLMEAIAAQDALEHELLSSVGKAVEKRAKERLGDYQEEAGPFVAWAELADSTKADRERQGYTENDPGLRSGEMRDSIKFEVLPGEVQIGSDDPNMEYFELGTTKQPPRSDLGGALVELTPKIVDKVGEGVVMALIGEGVVARKLIIE